MDPHSPAPGHPTTRRVNDAVRSLLIAGLAAVAYFVSARIGYALAIPQGVVTLWPPSGVMLALLVLSPRRDWPFLLAGGLVGSFISDRLSDFSPGLATAAALANATESLVAAWFVRRQIRGPVTLNNLRSVLYLTVGAAIVANAATALLGAAMLSVGFDTSFGRAWVVWWLGDGLGMLTVAPALIAWATPAPGWGRHRLLEAGVLLAVLVIGGQLALGPRQGWVIEPDPYISILIVFWAALRFGPRGAATGALVLAAVATWNVSLGIGPFASPAQTGPGVAAQLYVYLGLMSVAGLIPAAVLAERQATAERYRNVVETATDAIITIDPRDRIEFASAAVERVFGYRPDELIGHELTMLMPPAARERHRSALHRYLSTGERSMAWTGIELTGLRKDGTEIPLEVSYSELVDGGQHQFTGVIRDITERRMAERALRRSEEQARFAMEAASIGVWEWDVATGDLRWSPLLEEVHGLVPGTFGGTFEAFLERVDPEDRPAVSATIERAMTQRTDWHVTYRTHWPDGSPHWISGAGRTFYDDDGQPWRTAGIAMDVTEQRQLEEQYRQAQKMEAIGQLAGGVAHDFNNLLTAIKGFGSLLADALGPDSPHRMDLDEIRLAADRATSLTAQLLAFSRRQILAPQVMDLGETIRSMEPMLRRLIGEHIDIAVRSPVTTGHVEADPGQMQQVIMNLCVNARDAMPEGGTLTIEVHDVELDELYARRHIDANPGRYVMLAVSDSGFGMDAATRARVFEPFFTTKPAGKGTGLGLSTIHGIVKQSGGSVWVYSEPGQGSTFKVYLPRVEPSGETGPAVRRRAAQGGSETLLVVEDDSAIRRLTQRVLEQQGYRVIVASTPGEALRIAGSEATIDLLLTDMVLPEMSGVALAGEILAMRPGLRVLYMSGYTDNAVVQRGIMKGQTPFIQKPFGTSQLLGKVRAVLDGPAPPPDSAGLE